ncbi:MAG: SET domain-containing protein [Verrucomicrobiaceae bacterium]|nr:MAG: SET domain-containing protein [Verrucomicrobiaceae bacterium]
MAKKKTNSTATENNASHRKLLELWNRGQSKLCEVRDSGIHGRGVYASTFIPKETRIIEYIGELIGKEESEKRALKQHARSLKSGDAAVYIFTLSKNYDIDGNVPWNTARLINHSCNPNCEAWIVGRKIFIYSLRDIQEGEELGFDYGFDIECYEDHLCRCGSAECIGYIVSRAQWPDLRKRLEEKGKTTPR